MTMTSNHMDYDWTKSVLFRDFPYELDQRTPEYFFELPYFGTVGIVPLDFGFWISTFVLLSVQTVFNAGVALIISYLLSHVKSESTRQLVGFGILLPFLLLGPYYLCCRVFEFRNVALMLCLCGAIPNVLALRVVEALQGFLPAYAQEDWRLLLLYFSATLKIEFDPKTSEPVPFTWNIFARKLSSFLSVMIQTSLLFSLLIPFDYQVFPRRHSMESLANLFYWGNLANNFLMASLMSLVLDGGASGLGLLTSILTGYTLENFSESPLTRSSSPSDFWGNRWDRPVASSLRQGSFKPLRKLGWSRNLAALGTFVVSGFIHEYVLWEMTWRKGVHSYQQEGIVDGLYQRSYGNQFAFFLWNGALICIERWVVAQDYFFVSYLRRLPQAFQTALVLLLVLPIAHWFTDEYLLSSFFQDTAWAFPLIVFPSNSNTFQ